MRNSKLKKQDKIRKNNDLKKNGRTSRQVSLKKMKEDVSNYLIHHPEYKFPPTFSIDLKYFHMHRMIANKNKKLRMEAEARKLEEELNNIEKELK
jgi:hypothetical protein